MATIRTAGDFRALIARKKAAIGGAAGKAVGEIGDTVADRIKKLAPVDKGDLADTIGAGKVTVEHEVYSVAVSVGGGLDSPHVLSTEYGNGFQQAQPFIRPGLRQASDRAAQIVIDCMNEVV